MEVQIEWQELQRRNNRLWSANYCLYAYVHPVRERLLYLGKVCGSTVRQRLHGEHKWQLFRDLQRQYAIEGFRVLVGTLILEPGRRRTAELIADVESLLIHRLKPFGNISATRSRISRPGLAVSCIGAWPFARTGFRDV